MKDLGSRHTLLWKVVVCQQTIKTGGDEKNNCYKNCKQSVNNLKGCPFFNEDYVKSRLYTLSCYVKCNGLY